MSTSQSSNRKTALIFVLLVILVAVLLFINIMKGSVRMSVAESFSALMRNNAAGNNADDTFMKIIWSIRFPRALAAAILGGALALSGYLLQTFFNNPIAGPFVLGISSGAKMTVALAMIFLLGRGMRTSSFILILAAFAGAMLSMGFVLLVSEKLRHPAMLIVSGIMIGYICSAVTDIIVTFADESDIVNLHNWSLGSFSGISWDNVAVIAVVVAVTGGLVFAMSKQISAYMLGEAYAAGLGLNVRAFRVAVVILSGILSACVTAFAGPVSFVGIAVPQLVKRLFRTARPIIMIPACFLGGAVWCLFCDLIARTVFAPTELSISTVTAVFGAPVVIYVLLKRKREA